MKIVHIEDFFHPNAGYQINILAKYMAKNGHDVIIVTSKMDKVPQYLTEFFGKDDIIEADKKYTSQTGVKIIRLPIVKYISGRAVFQSKMFSLVDKLLPDILYIHGNDTLTGIRYLLRHTTPQYPIVMDSHMLEMASENPFKHIFRVVYKTVITPIIVKNNIKIIRTQDDDYVEKYLGIPLSQCPWISVGSDTMLFHPDFHIRKTFRKDNNIADSDFVVVYTGKLDKAKGGKFLAEAFQKKFFSGNNRNVVLIVIGNTSGEYGAEVENILNESENRIIRFSTQKYIDLAKFYQSADLSVFPQQCSLSFYDAQACGVPVVSEANNINIDRLKYSNGFNFQVRSVEDFRDKILRCVEMPVEFYREISRNAYNSVKKYYDYEQITDRYTEILIQEYNKFHLMQDGYHK